MKKTITLLIIGLCTWSAHAQSGLGRITFSSGGTNDSRLSVTMGEPLAGSYVSSDGKTILTVGAQAGSIRAVSPQDSLSLNNYTVNVSSPATNVNVQLTSNRSWTITNPNNWVTITPMTSSKNTSLSVAITANTTNTKRTASIMITAGTNTKVLTINQDGVTGVNEVASVNNDIKVYPNPACSEINVWVNSSIVKNYDVKILDISGKVVLESTSTNEGIVLPIINLTQGNYFINLSNKQNQFNKTVKILKTNN